MAQPSILRANQAGHGRVLNHHRESKGESITQNANWLATGQKPAVPAAVSRQRYQQRKLRQQQQQAAAQNAAQTPAPKPTAAQKPQAQTQPKPQAPPQPAQPKGVAAGTAQNAVNGKDLTGKFKFKRNSPDYAIEQVIKAQGFDGKPTLTDDIMDFTNACKASNFIAKRGVGATDKKTLDAYDQALKTGDFYVKCSGGSVHGYGMYCASVPANGQKVKNGLKSAEGEANKYANKTGTTKKIYTMTLDKSAKVGIENDLERQMRNDTEFNRICRNGSVRKDVGVYAAYKGYDAYIADGGRLSQDGNYSDYTVILNRSKVIIYDDSGVPF